MPLFLCEEILEFPVDDTVFLFERLCRNDMDKIRYLCAVRGNFDQELYDKVSLAVAIKGWRNLAGKNGLLAYPCRLPASAISGVDAEQLASLNALYTYLSDAEREGLHGRLYVVDHLPIDVFYNFFPKVRELEPEELKKKLVGSLNGSLPLPIAKPGESLLAMTVVPNAEPPTSSPPVIAEE